MICLKNKNIIITGASSGIGQATSILCSKLGARVLLIGRREEKLKEVISEMDDPSNQTYLVGDITITMNLNLISKKN